MILFSMSALLARPVEGGTMHSVVGGFQIAPDEATARDLFAPVTRELKPGTVILSMLAIPADAAMLAEGLAAREMPDHGTTADEVAMLREGLRSIAVGGYPAQSHQQVVGWMKGVAQQCLNSYPQENHHNRLARNIRQKTLMNWCHRAFGDVADVTDLGQRSRRFLEESVELVQSVGCTAEEAHKVVDYVFARPTGQPSQEVGGVMVTLMVLAEILGLSVATEEQREVTRILNKPLDHFRRRQIEKNEAGV